MYIFFFVFGLFWGSFLNNIALRLENNEDFLFSRSKCPNCKKKLSWKELIPVLSFIIQKGRCLNCGFKIPLRYLVVEILTGVWVYLLSKSIIFNINFLSLVEFLFYFIFLSIIFVLALYDLKTFLIDDRFIIFGLFVFILFFLFKTYFNLPQRDFTYLLNYVFNFYGKIEPLISALLLSSLFLLLYIITKGEGLGFGDVKVVFLIGLFLRAGDALFSILVSSFLGSIYGFYLILKNKKFKQPIPFVPFFFLGIMITIVFGYKLSKFYFDFFKL
jgi:leader peptidase (prepilin peptidase)/N-methyltransferase